MVSSAWRLLITIQELQIEKGTSDFISPIAGLRLMIPI
jgi:hypothetical protein